MTTEHHVAIIGVAGRFPDACNVEQFWINLREGTESVSHLSDEQMLAAGVPPEQLQRPGYVKAVACTPDVENFDAAFFGYTPREASHSDPQIRMMLEVAHSALENAGFNPHAMAGNVGVYASSGTNRYIDMHLQYAGDVSATSSFLLSSLNNMDYVASTISYKLNLRGPSITLSTACSSSLVAVHLAAQALRNGECDVTVAGGVDVELPFGHGYQWEEGGPVSRDGHVRPFDVSASGTLFGTGCGAIVLKRLDDAIGDGDTILAVVRGSAVNNDGSDKAGFSAPSVNGQAVMIAEALSIAGVSSTDISYVEAHATGTPLGDPIEVAALDKAFRAVAAGAELLPASCALSSVKGNVGHLGHAAGITSLIKAVLAISGEQIPATANFAVANPKLQLERTAFYVTNRLVPWPRVAGKPRFAGVSSFGVGGTNAHIVLGEAPARAVPPADVRPRIVVWSAKSDEAELAYRSRLAAHLKWKGDQFFPAAVTTLQEGRRGYPIRRALVAASAGEAATALSRTVIEGASEQRELVLAFPGQGSQQVDMAAGLYAADKAFARTLDHVLALFAGLGIDLRQPWRHGTAEQITSTTLAQPLLFAIEYSLAQSLIDQGARPAALVGHSLGELVAAVVAGVISLPDGVSLVMARSRAMALAPASGMIAVAAPSDELERIMPASLTVAVVNGPNQTVLAGAHDDIEAARSVLSERRIAHTRLTTSAAFHSPLMGSAAAAFAKAFDGVRLAPPQMELYSAAAGRRITDEEAVSPSFWSDQVARPVRFDHALDALFAAGRRLMIETGPGRTLTTIARRHPAVTSGESVVIPVLPRSAGNPEADRRSALSAVARMWVEGHDVSWTDVRQGEPLRRVPLPGYAYQRRRHWVTAPYQERNREPGQGDVPGTVKAGPGPGLQAPDADAGTRHTPFTTLSWVEQNHWAQPMPTDARCLALLPESQAAGLPLLLALQQTGMRPVIARPGQAYAEVAGEFRVRPANADDLDRMLAAMAARGEAPALLVHALTTQERAAVAAGGAAAALDDAFFSLLALLQAGGRSAGPAPGLLVLTSRSADVTGAEPIDPINAALHGFVRSVAKEAPQLGCRLIDMTAAADERELTGQIARWQQHDVVALRGHRSWVRAAVPFAAEILQNEAPIRRRGVYVITGGLGGLGMACARALAGTGLQPRLMLLGRTGLGADYRAARLHAQISELESLGAQVRVLTCDVTDKRALRRMVDIVTARYGPINGVLHLAGIAGDGLARLRAAEAAAAVLAPKVQGTLLLAEVLDGQPPVDFFVCFSSRAAIDGLAGSADYAAANAFEDAQAQVMRRASTPALSINWPSWAQVGMAAEHGMRTWSVELDPKTCVLLDEHRIDGVAVLPGTGHIDLALQAFRIITGRTGPVRLKDIVFRRVMAVHDAQRLEIRLFPDGRFEAWSRPVADPAAQQRLHASGLITGTVPPARSIDLDALRIRMPDHLDEDENDIPRIFSLGPRWDNNPHTWTLPGGDCAEMLLQLELASEFSSEVNDHALHPTLLDSATASVRRATDGHHLPFLYAELLVYDTLPARLFAHVRRSAARGGSITGDVDLIAPDGRLLAQVTGYTMRRVDQRELLAAAGGADGPERADPVERAEGTGAADQGITPQDGGRLLLALLRSRHHGQVAVEPGAQPWKNWPAAAPAAGAAPIDAAATPPSTVAAVTPPSTAAAATAPSLPAAPRNGQQPAPSPPVPALATASASSSGALEARLKLVWAEAIGESDINIDADFFDLGGTSLSGVGMMTDIRKAFGVELPIAALFDYPTVSSMALALWEQGAR